MYVLTCPHHGRVLIFFKLHGVSVGTVPSIRIRVSESAVEFQVGVSLRSLCLLLVYSFLKSILMISLNFMKLLVG